MEKIDIHIHTRLPKYSGEGRFKSTGSTETMDYLNKQQIVHGIIMSMGETELPNNAECAEFVKKKKIYIGIVILMRKIPKIFLNEWKLVKN